MVFQMNPEPVVRKLSFYNNPFIGLFIRANDEFALVPKNSLPRVPQAVEEALKVPVHQVFVNNSPYVGLFAAMNSKGCVMHSHAGQDELSLVKKLGLNVFLIEEHSACGNNILANDFAAMANPKISEKSAKAISDCLGVEVFRQPSLSGANTFGSANVVTNRGLLAHNDTPDAELKRMEKLFNVKGMPGTANFGSSFVGASVVANKHGAIIGDLTTGFETQRVFEALFG